MQEFLLESPRHRLLSECAFALFLLDVSRGGTILDRSKEVRMRQVKAPLYLALQFMKYDSGRQFIAPLTPPQMHIH